MSEPDQRGSSDFEALARRLAQSLGGVWTTIASPREAVQSGTDAAIRKRAAELAPVVWLIGKVQAGKSSIVAALTGSTAAAVGSGFKACTPTARIYDFPEEAPVIRFLDTRGLGEAGYDAAADIAFAEGHAHLLLVVMKAMDPAQDTVIAAVRAARRRHPEWPVLVAHTCLHEAYAAAHRHPLPYPFGPDGMPTAELPGDLARMLAFKRELIAELPGTGAIGHVAIDFTQPGDGFDPQDYGLSALTDALERVAPSAIAAALRHDAGEAGDAIAAQARPHILGYAAAAAAIDAVPVAGAVGVPGIQAKMLHSLAAIYGLQWDRRMIGELAGALGTGMVVRMLSAFGIRQIVKLIPVYGQTAGAATAAATSFATTYALGHAATYYLASKRHGAVDKDGVLTAYREALATAFGMAKARGLGSAATPSTEPTSA